MQFSEEMKTFVKSHAILKEHRDDWEDYTKKEN